MNYPFFLNGMVYRIIENASLSNELVKIFISRAQPEMRWSNTYNNSQTSLRLTSVLSRPFYLDAALGNIELHQRFRIGADPWSRPHLGHDDVNVKQLVFEANGSHEWDGAVESVDGWVTAFLYGDDRGGCLCERN